MIGNPKPVQVRLEVKDNKLMVFPTSEPLPAADIPLTEIKDVKLRRHTFDIDIFTIPFKVRPAVKDFSRN